MTTAERLKIRKIGNLACLLWIIAMGGLMWWSLPEGALENHASDTLKDRMSMECTGTYQDRYRCKEDLLIESGQTAFWSLSLRFLFVIVPPLVGSVMLSSYIRKHELDDIHQRHPSPSGQGTDHPHAAPAWKERAHLHSSTLTPEEAAEDMHLLDRSSATTTSSSSSSSPSSSPSSASDWKSRAQKHIHQDDLES